ncbi:PucR family transcriptional regulator [Corynebacterium provencense]|uniref:PucR family transcriptional regulator n=1 Tax=Corynebacterium provencense TaxID=1737425 RepID=UPI000830DD5A|nr:PucR family transcriptional regulator [Corynebacterium provencense]
MPDDLPTLRLPWLYAQHNLDLRPLVPATPDRGFTVVQPTELTDPGEFLAPQAVVLTVGVALSREHGPFPAYIDRLADAEVTAVGFGTGLFYPRVPPELVDAARHRGVALFEVPRSTAFISILNTVQAERTRRARLDQEHLISTQEQLSTAAVRGGVTALITDTASHLAAAVAVTDNDGRVQGRCDRTTADGVRLCAVDAAKNAALNNHSSADHRVSRGPGRPDLWRITQRMTLQGERVHFITVLADHPFTTHDRSVLKHAAGLADILLQRPAYLRRERTELNSLALRLHLGLGGSGTSGGQILDQAADGDGLVRPTVVAADRVADLDKARAEADRTTARGGRHLVTTRLETSTAVFLFRGSRAVEDIAGTFGSARPRVRIAVGEPVEWEKLTLERVRRLETAARTLTPGSVVGPYGAGTDWLDRPAVREALDLRASETVDRITAAGRSPEEGRELMQTLETWLRSGGKAAATAETLGVHRHTVRTRLNRIAEACEVDLDDPVVRAELLLVTVTRR